MHRDNSLSPVDYLTIKQIQLTINYMEGMRIIHHGDDFAFKTLPPRRGVRGDLGRRRATRVGRITPACVRTRNKTVRDGAFAVRTRTMMVGDISAFKAFWSDRPTFVSGCLDKADPPVHLH